MSHSHVCCLVHVVFSTAERRPFIRDEIRERLHGYLSGIARENEIQVLAVGGTDDRVHIDFSAADDLHSEGGSAIKVGKSGSSKGIHQTFPGSFAWQEGYGAFSVGVSQTAATVRYILSQIEHHQRISFEDELKKVLSIHGIDEDSSRP